MGVNCMILREADKDYVQGGPCPANDGTAYGSGVWLKPTERESDGDGKRYILNVLVLADTKFAAAQPYLSGMPILNSSDPNFPDPLPEPDE